jgi:rod shape-determining protein MreC
MRNIITLLIRYHNFLLFLGLQVIALAILYNSGNFHRSELLSHSSDITGAIYSRRSDLTRYLRLGEINDALSLENADLRGQLADKYRIRNDIDSVIDTTLLQRYEFRSASVVNATVNREQNFLMLDRGYEGGIRPDMGVIANGCLVGVTRSVSRHFSMVMPVIHSDFKASVRIGRNGSFGSLVWRGGDAAIAKVIEIPKNIQVNPGDTIFTTGYSTYFPPMIWVGQVVSVDDSDNDYHVIDVRLAADFRRISYVDIVTDLLQSEQDSLIEKEQATHGAASPH